MRARWWLPVTISPPRSAPAQNESPLPVRTSTRSSFDSPNSRMIVGQLAPHRIRDRVFFLGAIESDGDDAVRLARDLDRFHGREEKEGAGLLQPEKVRTKSTQRRMAIHIAITRRVRPGCEAEFQQALREFFQASFAHGGVQGVHMLAPPPESELREYGILRTFASAAEREDFYRVADVCGLGSARRAARRWRSIVSRAWRPRSVVSRRQRAAAALEDGAGNARRRLPDQRSAVRDRRRSRACVAASRSRLRSSPSAWWRFSRGW